MPIFDGGFGGQSVDTDSPEFKRKLQWVQDQLVPHVSQPTLRVFTTWNPKETSQLKQGVYVWNHRATAVEILAFRLDQNPTAAVVDIVRDLSLPIPLPLMETWEEFVVRTAPTPVGDPVPGTPRLHFFAAGFNAADWPEGSTATKGIGGRAVVFRRGRMQIKPGEGPMGAGGVYQPIWEMLG